MQMTVRELMAASQHHFVLSLVSGEHALTRCVTCPSIQRTGLALAGLISAIVPGSLHIWAKSEVAFISAADKLGQAKQVGSLVTAGVPAVIVSRDRELPETLRSVLAAHDLPILSSPLETSSLISKLHDLLFDLLSPHTTMHAVHVDVFGVGVVLTGQSGIGKSECALDLVLRGHRLIADDAVVVRRRENLLIGASAPTTKHHMEVRGLGIINVKDLFGTASVCDKKSLDLVVEMVDWRPREAYDRLGLDEMYESIFGVEVPKVRLPVSPGRNLASIVEVAARNYLLKAQGHHAAKRFQERIRAERDPSCTRQTPDAKERK